MELKYLLRKKIEISKKNKINTQIEIKDIQYIHYIK